MNISVQNDSKCSNYSTNSNKENNISTIKYVLSDNSIVKTKNDKQTKNGYKVEEPNYFLLNGLNYII